MTLHDTVPSIWKGQACVVAATGPSLTEEVVERVFCEGINTIAVNDAYRLMPWADALYACDGAWWDHHKACRGFGGAKWSSHQAGTNDKLRHARLYGLSLVNGSDGQGFSTDPAHIHYGGNSGFQAINLALLFGAIRIVCIGFDMQTVDDKAHFFGNHPGRLQRSTNYERFCNAFRFAAKTLPPGVEIINATPNSALKCFPRMPLETALARTSANLTNA